MEQAVIAKEDVRATRRFVRTYRAEVIGAGLGLLAGVVSTVAINEYADSRRDRAMAELVAAETVYDDKRDAISDLPGVSGACARALLMYSRGEDTQVPRLDVCYPDGSETTPVTPEMVLELQGAAAVLEAAQADQVPDRSVNVAKDVAADVTTVAAFTIAGLMSGGVVGMFRKR